MRRKKYTWILTLTVLCLFLVGATDSLKAEAIIADHQASADFDLVPDSIIQTIGESYQVFYGHTSHGSQIMTGLDMLYEEDTSYNKPYFYEYGDDLGGYGDTSWVPPTRNFLNTHPDCNLVMWSWCGGVSDNTEEGIDTYLNAMNGLEQDYPDVKFIYMTGHLDGSGPTGNLYVRNNQIRAYCTANCKVLFDFADIESYDPDSSYYPDASDACEWCYTWCSSHTCLDCAGCAHSHCFNCYQKGKGWWWMMARIWGWNSSQGSVPHIISTSPQQSELNVPVDTDITATFSMDMDSTTIDSATFLVNAGMTGVHWGTISYSSLSRKATFDPSGDFEVGETVSVTLTADMHSIQDVPLESDYVWSFTIMINRGDCNGDGVIDVGDVVYLVNYLYKNGSSPNPLESGDTNCDGKVDVGDVVFLLNYLFKSGIPPAC
jgi:hypothetical protein